MKQFTLLYKAAPQVSRHDTKPFTGSFNDCTVLQGSQIIELMTQLYIKVQPDSKGFRIKEGQIPVIELENKAENGRANAELVSRLEKITGEKPGIISGHRSRRKKIKIEMSEEKFREKISQGEKQ